MNLAGLCTWNEHTRAVLSDIRKYIGPGLLVTVGFIDPGNWAANVAAGSLHGYTLPWTIFLQIYLTSSKKVMGSHANTTFGAILLWSIAAIVSGLNVMLLLDFLR